MRFMKTLACVAALLAPTSTLAVDLNAMTDQERTLFRAEVRQYLLDNPEVLLEAMDVLRARDSQAEANADAQLLAQHQEALFNDGFSWVGGNPDGDITVVEFLDYRCGYCRKAHPEVTNLIAQDGNIRVVIKEFPILGEDSTMAAQIAIATLQHYGDDAYYKMHNVLMAFKGPINAGTLATIAGQAGLAPEPLAKLVESAAVANQIAKTRELAQNMQMTGTPGFVIGDTVLRGYLPLADMQAVVAQARARLN